MDTGVYGLLCQIYSSACRGTGIIWFRHVRLPIGQGLWGILNFGARGRCKIFRVRNYKREGGCIQVVGVVCGGEFMRLGFWWLCWIICPQKICNWLVRIFRLSERDTYMNPVQRKVWNVLVSKHIYLHERSFHDDWDPMGFSNFYCTLNILFVSRWLQPAYAQGFSLIQYAGEYSCVCKSRPHILVWSILFLLAL